MNNCFFYAISKWFKHGGYLIIRKSKAGPYPHFIWCKDLKNAEIEHYVPNTYKPKIGFFHKILFSGHIKTNDN